MKNRGNQGPPEEPRVSGTHDNSAGDSGRQPRAGETSPRKGRRRIVVAILLIAAVVGGAFLASRPGGSDVTAATGAATDLPGFSGIDRFVEAEMDAQRIPGLSLAVVRDDRIVHMRGFGDADQSGRAVSPQTPFVIGSVAKSVTALAIMQLVEAGTVKLDAPVVQYIPWFRVADEEASAEITVRHLLNHTSGLSTKTGRSFQGNGDTTDSALEQAVRELRTVELTEAVGEVHQYSTIGYSVLGLIVQTVSGQTYESYVQEHIFDPLKMRTSFTSKADAEPTAWPRATATGSAGPQPPTSRTTEAWSLPGFSSRAPKTWPTTSQPSSMRAGTTAWPFSPHRGRPHSTAPLSRRLKPARPMAWAGLSVTSTMSRRSFIRERRSTITRTSC